MRAIRLLLVFLIILTLLAACGGDEVDGPGQDPLAPGSIPANSGQDPLDQDGSDSNTSESEDESSSGLCGALPASLILLGVVGLAVGRRTRI